MKQVLVATAFWVEHFRRASPGLVELLERDALLIHPMVLGELTCGMPPRRAQTLADLGDLRQAQQASPGEGIDFVERERLFGLGCGLVDLTLLASTLITPGAEFWTLDRRLAGLALGFGVSLRYWRINGTRLVWHTCCHSISGRWQAVRVRQTTLATTYSRRLCAEVFSEVVDQLRGLSALPKLPLLIEIDRGQQIDQLIVRVERHHSLRLQQWRTKTC